MTLEKIAEKYIGKKLVDCIKRHDIEITKIEEEGKEVAFDVAMRLDMDPEDGCIKGTIRFNTPEKFAQKLAGMCALFNPDEYLKASVNEFYEHGFEPPIPEILEDIGLITMYLMDLAVDLYYTTHPEVRREEKKEER